MNADGKPASADQVKRLRERIELEPARLTYEPEMFQTITRKQFEELKKEYARREGPRDGAFQDVAQTAHGPEHE